MMDGILCFTNPRPWQIAQTMAQPRARAAAGRRATADASGSYPRGAPTKSSRGLYEGIPSRMRHSAKWARSACLRMRPRIDRLPPRNLSIASPNDMPSRSISSLIASLEVRSGGEEKFMTVRSGRGSQRLALRRRRGGACQDGPAEFAQFIVRERPEGHVRLIGHQPNVT